MNQKWNCSSWPWIAHQMSKLIRPPRRRGKESAWKSSLRKSSCLKIPSDSFLLFIYVTERSETCMTALGDGGWGGEHWAVLAQRVRGRLWSWLAEERWRWREETWRTRHESRDGNACHIDEATAAEVSDSPRLHILSPAISAWERWLSFLYCCICLFLSFYLLLY